MDVNLLSYFQNYHFKKNIYELSSLIAHLFYVIFELFQILFYLLYVIIKNKKYDK